MGSMKVSLIEFLFNLVKSGRSISILSINDHVNDRFYDIGLHHDRIMMRSINEDDKLIYQVFYHEIIDWQDDQIIMK